MSLHKEFWGFLFLAFVAWIFIAPNGETRIQHACSPVSWAGNVAVSLTALAVPEGQGGVKKWSEKAEYGCEYTAWRLFYQKKYDEYLKNQKGVAPVPAGAQLSPLAAKPAAPAKGVLP